MTSVDAIKATILAVCDTLASQADDFRQLDALVGDGDLGVTVTMSCEAVRASLDTVDVDTIGGLLRLTGNELARANPSTLTGLVREGLKAAAGELGDATSASQGDWARPLQKAVEAIQSRGGAELGDKTIVDALNGSLVGLTAARAATQNPRAIARAVREGAESAAAALVNQESRTGRAAWLGKRTIGVPDPGAAVWVEVTRAIEATVAQD